MPESKVRSNKSEPNKVFQKSNCTILEKCPWTGKLLWNLYILFLQQYLCSPGEYFWPVGDSWTFCSGFRLFTPTIDLLLHVIYSSRLWPGKVCYQAFKLFRLNPISLIVITMLAENRLCCENRIIWWGKSEIYSLATGFHAAGEWVIF